MSAATSPGRLTLCSDVSRAAGEDPIGTAPHWRDLTVLELDVPLWDRFRQVDAWTPEQKGVFEALRARVEREGVGFGLLLTAPAERGGRLRVRHLTRGPGGFTRRDYLSDLSQTEWARGLHDTLLEPDHLRAWEEHPVPPGPDVHVCTHGTVDAACGRYGVPVFQALRAAGLRSWRTAHFGGHRFAATAVELPSGLMWAHLAPELAVRVARREVHPAEVARNLRGFVGLPPRAQVLDRGMLVRHGWDWLNAERTAEVDGTRVTLRYDLNGVPGVVCADVEDAPPLELPGSSHSPKLTTAAQYRVTNLTGGAIL